MKKQKKKQKKLSPLKKQEKNLRKKVKRVKVMSSRKNAYIEVIPYMEGWALQGRIDLRSKVSQLYNTNSLMSVLLDTTKEDYLAVIVPGGATLGPQNDVSYFPTEVEALAMVDTVYNMIDFTYGDTVPNNINF